MADSAAIFAAITAKLVNDATLTGLMPDGVYRDISLAGKTRFVVISKSGDSRRYVFNGMAVEEMTYMVKAVTKGTSGLQASAAAARIYTLLHNANLVIAGYTLLGIQQAEENAVIEYQEPDPVDSDARWQHRGWLFDVEVSPI